MFVTVAHHWQVLRVQNVFRCRLVDHPGYVTSLLGEGRGGGREEGLVNFLGGSFGSSSGSGLLFLKKGSGGADIRSAQ